MKILIDGDGCPVIKKAIKVAKNKNIDVIVFIDTSHVFYDDFATIITVDKGDDAVDFALVNRIVKDDIVITQDYGLASMALAKNAKVVNQNGLIFTEYNIDGLLNNRHFAKEARKNRTKFKQKNAKKRTEKNDEEFLIAFNHLIN